MLAMVDMMKSHGTGLGWTKLTVNGGFSALSAASTMVLETVSGGIQATTPEGLEGKFPSAMLDFTMTGTQSVVDQAPLLIDPET
jgi:hypothetical protein